MERTTWGKINELFEAARHVPAEEREAWVRAATADEHVRAEVLSLLHAHEDDPWFVDQPGGTRTPGRVTPAGAWPGRPTPTPRVWPRLPRPPPPLRAFAARLSRKPESMFAAYRLVREIARDPARAVFEAVATGSSPHPRVALHVLAADASDPVVSARLHAQGDLLARLDHPAIPRLLNGGVTADGTVYLAFEYATGDPLDEWCRARRLAVRGRVERVAAVCDAVQHAHEHLVVHGGLRPSNILVPAGEALKLLDCGMAALVREAGARRRRGAAARVHESRAGARRGADHRQRRVRAGHPALHAAHGLPALRNRGPGARARPPDDLRIGARRPQHDRRPERSARARRRPRSHHAEGAQQEPARAVCAPPPPWPPICARGSTAGRYRWRRPRPGRASAAGAGCGAARRGCRGAARAGSRSGRPRVAGDAAARRTRPGPREPGRRRAGETGRRGARGPDHRDGPAAQTSPGRPATWRSPSAAAATSRRPKPCGSSRSPTCGPRSTPSLATPACSSTPPSCGRSWGRSAARSADSTTALGHYRAALRARERGAALKDAPPSAPLAQAGAEVDVARLLLDLVEVRPPSQADAARLREAGALIARADPVLRGAADASPAPPEALAELDRQAARLRRLTARRR